MLFDPQSLASRNRTLLKKVAVFLEVDFQALEPFPPVIIIERHSANPTYLSVAHYNHKTRQINFSPTAMKQVAQNKSPEFFVNETLIHENAHFIHHCLIGEAYVKMWPPPEVRLSQVGTDVARDFAASYKWLEGMALRITHEVLNFPPPTVVDVEYALRSGDLAFYFHQAGEWQVSQLDKAHFLRLTRLTYCHIDRISPLPPNLDIFQRK